MAVLHVAMYPWLAMGHLTSFLHLANKLAENGHTISLFLPPKAQKKLDPFNLHPNLISFIPIEVPHVDGLPPGAETTAEVPIPLHSLLVAAMDLTRPAIQQALGELKPNLVFFDMSHWIPQLLQELDIGAKSVRYIVISPTAVTYVTRHDINILETSLIAADFMNSPPSFPPSSIKLQTHEAKAMVPFMSKEFGRGISFRDRLKACTLECDAIVFKACKEMEGQFCDYLETQWGKPVLLAGPVLPEPPAGALEEKWATWLDGFKPKTVVYCAFGSECILNKDQFQELVLGFELTGLPFFVALKPPMGVESVEAALPEGFEERVHGRGVVYGGWVQQPLILRHPSVGCFVTHCGSGSLMEGLLSEGQLVLLPNVADQIINARLLGADLKVGVEVEKGDEDGLFTREGVCKAVKSVMEEESKVGKEVRANHDKWRGFLSTKGLENSYIQGFVQNLHDLLAQK